VQYTMMQLLRLTYMPGQMCKIDALHGQLNTADSLPPAPAPATRHSALHSDTSHGRTVCKGGCVAFQDIVLSSRTYSSGTVACMVFAVTTAFSRISCLRQNWQPGMPAAWPKQQRRAISCNTRRMHLDSLRHSLILCWHATLICEAPN
jgi:hypothetical protein